MIITIDNIKEIQDSLGESVVHRVRIIEKRKWWKFFFRSRYRLLNDLEMQLRDGSSLILGEDFIWDLSSVPRFLWGIFPPDGDFEVGALIHDALYQSKMFSRKYADVEMFAWSKAVAGTTGRNKWSDIDNWIRYAMVRIFGWIVWYR